MSRTPVLDALNAQAARDDGRIVRRIRMHSADLDALRDELEAIFAGDPLAYVRNGMTEAELQQARISGVPIVTDDTLYDGPVIDWEERPDIEAAVARLNELFGRRP